VEGWKVGNSSTLRLQRCIYALVKGRAGYEKFPPIIIVSLPVLKYPHIIPFLS